MKIRRRKTRKVSVGGVKIGGGAPVVIQSMTKTDTRDVNRTIRQIKELEKAGCEIVRVAVKDSEAARAISKIKAKIRLPLVADIHFHWRLALEALNNGADKIRLNPGNIRDIEGVRAVAQEAKGKKVPIRIGVNSGSLRKSKPKSPVTKISGSAMSCGGKQAADLMVESALRFIRLFEDLDFYDIVISLKGSDVAITVEAYRKMARICDYPFHLGITAAGLSAGQAGLPGAGLLKSAIGLGTLLLEGIGDTIRVSLTGDPVEEVKAAREILKVLDLRNFGPQIISCPTCGRCEVDLVEIVKKFERKLNGSRVTGHESRPLKVAIMGCEVNGPGEARDADIGIAAGKSSGVLFKNGEKIKKVKEKDFVSSLMEQLDILGDVQKRVKSKKSGNSRPDPIGGEGCAGLRL